MTATETYPEDLCHSRRPHASALKPVHPQLRYQPSCIHQHQFPAPNVLPYSGGNGASSTQIGRLEARLCGSVS